MEQEIAFTKKTSSIEAVNELCRQLKHDSDHYIAIMFFASSVYNFEEISVLLKERFPNSEVIGTSTSGEITYEGFANNSIILTTMACSRTKVKGLLIREATKFPVIYKSEIEKTIRDCGIQIDSQSSHLNAFAITFINGLCNIEEAVMSLFYAIIKNDKFMVAGGTAGDDLKLKQTFVSYNGQTVSDGAVFLFVKTPKKFDIRNENIFKSSGKQITISDVDIVTRRITKINNAPALSVYSKELGISESDATRASLEHPFGRVFGGNIFISSLAVLNSDKSIDMYSRIIPNTRVEILQPEDPIAIANKTCEELKETIPNPGFILFINCILRTMEFNQLGIFGKLTSIYKDKLKTKYCGYSSYGEQYGKMNTNQTLVTVLIEE